MDTQEGSTELVQDVPELNNQLGLPSELEASPEIPAGQMEPPPNALEIGELHLGFLQNCFFLSFRLMKVLSGLQMSAFYSTLLQATGRNACMQYAYAKKLLSCICRLFFLFALGPVVFLEFH